MGGGLGMGRRKTSHSPFFFIGDTCLPYRCSQQLHAQAKGPKDLVLFDGDNHGLTRNSRTVVSHLQNFARCVFDLSIIYAQRTP
jgi:hypothetical protein